jgi:hypothetical protein
MITVKQIERLWNARLYPRLIAQLAAMRPEGIGQFVQRLANPVATAAMAIIRLEELNQSHVPLCRQMIRVVLSSQHPDGGWDDPAVTALSIHALMCCNGQGLAIDRGIEWLAALQRPEGLWPVEPIRRLAGDSAVSAFILYQLAADDRFAQVARLDDAMAWFEQHRGNLDHDAARLWQAAVLRLRISGHRPTPVAA